MSLDTPASSVPPARLIYHGPLIVERFGGQVWQLEVWKPAVGNLVAIVRENAGELGNQEMGGNVSLMNGAGSIYAAIQDRYPDSVVIEFWPNEGGPLRESQGEGGRASITGAFLTSRSIPISRP